MYELTLNADASNASDLLLDARMHGHAETKFRVIGECERMPQGWSCKVAPWVDGGYLNFREGDVIFQLPPSGSPTRNVVGVNGALLFSEPISREDVIRLIRQEVS